MRTTWARGAAAALVAPVLVLTAACAAGSSVGGSSSTLPSSSPPSSTRAPTPVPTVSMPADGVSLAGLGVTNGPAERVFVPRSALVSVRVDQANNVALVMPSPGASDLAAFLRVTLPANGFTITADNAAADTLTFAGFGWTGTFTGDAQASALLLRPAS